MASDIAHGSPEERSEGACRKRKRGDAMGGSTGPRNDWEALASPGEPSGALGRRGKRRKVLGRSRKPQETFRGPGGALESLLVVL